MTTLNEARAEPTLKDIATAAGLSVAAVSKVLNNREGVSQASRDRVMKIMADLGYRGRGGRLSSEPLREATVLTLGRYVMNDSFYGEILSGIVDAGKVDGFTIDVKIVSDGDGSRPLQQIFPAGLPKAIALMGIDGAALIDEISVSGIPTVLVNGMDRSMRLPSVSPDYHYGGAMATRHLLELGHRNLLHITHPYRETIRRRIDGFRYALEDAGIAFDADRHLLDLGSPGMLTIEARDMIAEHLGKMTTPPTGIVAVNDIVAIAAIQAVQAMGLSVPEDVSVIGFDDLPVGAHASPPLTTMRVDRREVGRIAVRLLQSMNEAIGVQRITLGAILVDRASTCRVMHSRNVK